MFPYVSLFFYCFLLIFNVKIGGSNAKQIFSGGGQTINNYFNGGGGSVNKTYIFWGGGESIIKLQ